MKKKIILLPFIGLLIYVLTTSSANGPGGDLTVGGCSCHNPTATASTAISIQLLDASLAPVTTYVAGNAYTIRLTGTQTNAALSLPRFGYQLSVVKSTATSVSAGTMVAPPGSHLISAGVSVVEHTGGSILSTTGTGGTTPATTYVRNVTWTAPASGFTEVSIRGVINAVNGDGTNSSADKWNNSSLAIAELGAITGANTVCQSATTTLSSTYAGGVWSSSDGSIASVTTSSTTSGLVTGNTPGTAIISYSGGGNIVTKVITVNATPSTFGGTHVVCATQSTTLTNTTSSGVWSCPTTTIATVVPGTGLVTGVGAGTALVTYTVGSCSATTTVTVNPLAANTGIASVCTGNSTALSNPNPGGTWSSSNTGVATVNTSGSTGTIAGLSVGTSNIIYSLPTGCNATTTVSVNESPAAIGGTLAVCSSGTTTATNTIGGGIWSTSTGSGIATVGSTSGIVTGISTSGNANLTYTLPGGCFATAVITINPLPTAISGGSLVCANNTLTLASTPSGGTWSSSNASVATISTSSGLLTPTSTSGGTTTISYALSTGCARSSIVTVNPISPISGTLVLCQNSTTALSVTPGAGTWTSSNTAVATVVPPTGVVTGVAGGTSIITYTTGTGCVALATVTVNPIGAITGGNSVCVGSTLGLANTTTGGTWTSSNTAVGTINSTSGVVSAISTGTTGITYTTGTGCIATSVITVNAAPGSVTGSGGGTYCVSTTITASGGAGGTIYFQGTTAGGTSTATPSVSQVVTSSGIYYFRVQSALGCWGPEASIAVTLNPLPASITGGSAVCENAGVTLSSTPTGGTWVSSDITRATIGSTNGIVAGLLSGTTILTYTAPTGCATTTTLTVNPAPGAVSVSGSGSFCSSTSISATGGAGGTIYYQGNTPGGTSTTTTGLTQTVSSTGIYYFRSQSSLGCWGNESSVAVTINPNPGAITGPSAICVTANAPMTSASTGGTWLSSNTSVATISAGGIVTGISAGVTTLTYTISATGCFVTKPLTVNALPGGITGTLSLCLGTTSLLSNVTAGGTWSSDNTSVVSVSPIPIAGVGVGTANVSYILPTGCSRSIVATVNALPAAITGASSMCNGSGITLTSVTTGGTWGSTSGNVTVGSTSGSVTGTNSGTATITYTIPTGCFVTKTITINPLPATSTGTLSVCIGASTALSNSTSGGTWESSNTSVALVGSTTGNATGIAAGTTLISYILPTSCYSISTLTVNALPSVITGTAVTCVGVGTTLLSAPAGGTWSSTNTGIASITASSGVMTGVATGNTTISYRLPNGCFRTIAATINPAPTAGVVSGSSSVCSGLTIPLSSTVAGGTWSSSAPSIATVSATGVVTGITAGTTNISYTVNDPCGTVFTVKTVTITNSAVSGTITGPANVCIGSDIALASSVLGGTWSSSSSVTANIGLTTGVVTGLSAGTTTITYTISSSCGVATTVAIVSVNPLPAAISGSTSVCVNASTILTNTGTGTWSSSAVSVADIDVASGAVTGISAGTATITFMSAQGCIATKALTVVALPAVISGSLVMCAGGTSALSNTSGAGTWTSSNSSQAIIGATSGFVNSINSGNPDISFTLTATGCVRIATLTINPVPAAITGTLSACSGNGTILTNTSGGGTWSSSNTTVATIDVSTGVVAGLSAGTTLISYQFGTGCRKVSIFTVNPLPSAITGSLQICTGTSGALSSTPAGGTWSSSNLSIASISSTSGMYSGIAAGTSVISYTSASGCMQTTIVTINPLPAAISGTTALCAGGTETLSSSTTGGIWISDNTAVATVDVATGIISGLTSGTAGISYRLTSGCATMTVVTVNALPATISGAMVLCAGTTSLLGSSPAGGTWTSSNTSTATIDASTGNMAGLATGISTISYQLSTGCLRTTTVTINPLPADIAGTMVLCAGAVTTLTDVTPGGSWSSSTPAVAGAGATGIITGLAAGTSTISYTLASGCRTTAVVTVNPLPGAITGATSVCLGASTTISSTPTGGTWASSTTSIGTIGSATGTLTGLAAGTTEITYTLPTGCMRVTTMTVNPLPAAGTISGSSTVCVGATATLATTATGGFWSITTGKSAVSVSGVMSGLSAGADTIRYSVTTVCGTAASAFPVTVNPLPAAGTISGSNTLCLGYTTVLSGSASGGSWNSASPSIATVSGTGIVLGMALGTATISYTVTNICGTATATTNVTVIPLVDPGVITGASMVCEGDTIQVDDSAPGGTWSSSNVGVATVSAAGVVTGISPGTAVIRYRVTNICSADTATLTVTVKPAAECGTRIVNDRLSLSSDLRLYPNPTNGDLKLETDLRGKMTISTIDGKLVSVYDISSQITEIRLPVQLNAGIYICRFVTANGQVQFIKLVYQP